MKFSIAFVLIFIELCDSNDFQCVHLTDGMESVEFYCENFNETLPVNCSTTSLYVIARYDKSKVKRLKIGGCNEDKVARIIDDFPNIRSLDIYCSNLQSMKPFNIILQHLQTCNASHNQLTEYPREFCSQMPRLMELDISYNNLTHVWCMPVSLKWLSLSHNKIRFISAYDLTDLPNLEIVDLSHNLLNYIDHYDAFGSFKHLKTLGFEGNRFKLFDGRILHLLQRGVAIHFSWEYLTTLKIRENDEKPIRFVLNSTVNGVFLSSDGYRREFHCREESFNNIRVFKIIDNHIENPGEMFRCLTPSLERIILSGSFGETLHSTSFEPFINLWELIINGARSMEFDLSSIKNPKRLLILDISGNNLEEIRNVSLLENIPFSDNIIATKNELKNYYVGRQEFFDAEKIMLKNIGLFPAWMEMPPDICYLNVANNQLKNAPELIHHFRPEVSILYLSGNYVGKLNVTTFERVDLFELHLRNTNLLFNDLRPFEPFKSLRKLDISDNNLGNANFTVPSMVFKNLTHFSASHCNITNVMDLMNQFGPNIERLDLSGNYLNLLPDEAFENYTELRYLNLSHANLSTMEFSFDKQLELMTLDLSYNNLKNVDLFTVPRKIEALYLAENELTQIQHLSTFEFLWKLSISISKKQIPCTTLAQLEHNRPENLKFLDNPFEQKHGDCSSAVRLINNLGFIGTLISKWF